MRLSTPPLARAVATWSPSGLPPARVTSGAVKPNPGSSTVMLVTTPVAISAFAVSAVGVTPGEVIVTVGG